MPIVIGKRRKRRGSETPPIEDGALTTEAGAPLTTEAGEPLLVE